MPASKKPDAATPLWAPHSWRPLMWLGLLLMAMSAHGDFTVSTIQARLADQAVRVSGNLELALSNKPEEALSKGIPLDITIDIELYRERLLVWNEKMAGWVLQRKIRYHALSGQYLVSGHQPDPERIENFSSLQEALQYIGAVNDLTLPIAKTLPADDRTYLVAVRVSLDIETLPAPLRPVAYTSPSWHLNSGWTTWEAQR